MPRPNETAQASRRTVAVWLLTALMLAGCGRLSSPTAPTALWRRTLPSWSPYVVIQANDGALAGYQAALQTLAAHGAVTGARIGLFADGRSEPTVAVAASLGLDVVGIIDDSDLSYPDIERVFDRYYATYPQVKTFQVGNEITTFGPVGSRMSIEQYMGVLDRVYAHVVAAYPDVTLVAQSTFGSGEYGAIELYTMCQDLKVRRMSPRRLVVAVNVYSQRALTAYGGVIENDLSNYRVWVTETGVPDQGQQLSYVDQVYPRLITLLHADRIYWYALWEGDAGGDSEFSLIKNPTHPPIVPGPLFRALTEP
jgi:hypothetical protein